MQRAVITGLGLVSCIGQGRDAVVDSLKAGRSGLSFNATYAEMGFKSQVSGTPQADFSAIDLDQK